MSELAEAQAPARTPEGDLWVFAYGSLLWRPDFPFKDKRPAWIDGWRRALCVYSWVHRGVRERPGLVLGLDPGGETHGALYRVSATHVEATLEYLRWRELRTDAYSAHAVTAALTDTQLTALTFVANRASDQYAGVLSLERQAKIVVEAEGESGPNPDYVRAAAAHLREAGMADPDLDALVARLDTGRESPAGA